MVTSKQVSEIWLELFCLERDDTARATCWSRSLMQVRTEEEVEVEAEAIGGGSSERREAR